MTQACQLEPPLVARSAVGDRVYRVLIVDDDDVFAGCLVERFRMEGHTAQAAGDAAEALSMAGRLLPDLVIVDLGLPGASGLEVARGLRRHPWGRSASLVVLSGYDDDHHLEAAREAGYDAYLVKPVRFREVRRLLGRSEAAR